MVKAFGCSIDFALHELSFVNIMMYNAILPSVDTGDKKDVEKVINASDPRNKELTRRIMFGN